jgi:hypothetical protein
MVLNLNSHMSQHQQRWATGPVSHCSCSPISQGKGGAGKHTQEWYPLVQTAPQTLRERPEEGGPPGPADRQEQGGGERYIKQLEAKDFCNLGCGPFKLQPAPPTASPSPGTY